MPDPVISLEELKFTFAEDDSDTIVVTLPCGCTAHLMSKARGGVNQFGNPMQFSWYCNHHFYGW